MRQKPAASRQSGYYSIELKLNNPEETVRVWARRGLTPLGDDYTPSSAGTVAKVLRVRNPLREQGPDWMVKFLDNSAEERLHRALAERADTRDFIVPLAAPQRRIVLARIEPEQRWRPVKVSQYVEVGRRSRGDSASEKESKKSFAVGVVSNALQQLAIQMPIDLDDDDWQTSNNTIVTAAPAGDRSMILFHDFGCSVLPKDSVC